MAKKYSPQPTGMIWVVSYFVLLAVNAVVLWLANGLFPDQVVLGTMTISKGWAIFHSMSALALLDLLVMPVVRVIENRQERIFQTKDWMIAYFLVNAIGVWVLGRFADQLGMGIQSWGIALFLGLAFDILQGFAMMALEPFRARLA